MKEKILVKNPFTDEWAEVHKYWFMDLEGNRTLKNGFLYKEKFIEVYIEDGIIEIVRVYDKKDYLEVYYKVEE